MECSEYQAIHMVALGVQVEDLFVHEKEDLFVCIEEGPFCSTHFFKSHI